MGVLVHPGHLACDGQISYTGYPSISAWQQSLCTWNKMSSPASLIPRQFCLVYSNKANSYHLSSSLICWGTSGLKTIKTPVASFQNAGQQPSNLKHQSLHSLYLITWCKWCAVNVPSATTAIPQLNLSSEWRPFVGIFSFWLEFQHSYSLGWVVLTSGALCSFCKEIGYPCLPTLRRSGIIRVAG